MTETRPESPVSTTASAEPATSGSTPTTGSSRGAETGPSTAGTSSEVVGTLGTTTIADVVVSKIAGLAAREVGGVHGVGGNTARVVGALRERIPGGRTNVTQGVTVEVGERQAAVDVSLIAEYGVAIHELAEAVRQNVIAAVEGMTGLEVTEVDVVVSDVHVPGDDDSEPPTALGAAPEARPRVR